MDKEAEILKERTLQEKRSNKLTVISLILLGVGIASAISFQSEHPLVALVLVPLIIGSTTGFIFSIFSVRLNYETTKKLIEIQYTLDEIKMGSENLSDESPLMILKKRLVIGKITKSEYEDLKSTLE